MGIQKRDGPEGWLLLSASGEFLTTSFLLMVFQTWQGMVFSVGSLLRLGKADLNQRLRCSKWPHCVPTALSGTPGSQSRVVQPWASLGISDVLRSGRWHPPCWISQPIALNKVCAYLLIDFYVRQWWIQLFDIFPFYHFYFEITVEPEDVANMLSPMYPSLSFPQ